MTLTCAKCGRRHPLTEDDILFFFPRFFCLSCGEKLQFNVDEKKLAALRQNNDLDRRIPESAAGNTPQTLRVMKSAGAQGSDGG